MRYRGILACALGFAVHASAPAYAQVSQELSVPKDARWKHGPSAIKLEPVLAGLQLYKITSTAPMELDIQARYDAPDQSTFATVYIFRPGGGDLAVWFDRATASITGSDRWLIASTFESGSFTPPGSELASGLRAIYALQQGTYKSTGLAMLALDGWVAKIRITSSTLNAAELKALANDFIGQIGWPESVRKASASSPVADCAKPLVFGKPARPARRSKDNALANALVSALMNSPDLEKEDGAVVRTLVYCRDSVLGIHGIYRAEGQADGYLLALGDSGRAAAVQPAMGLLNPSGSKSFSVSFYGLDQTSHYLDHDRLVPPAQLMDIINKQQPVSSVAKTASGSSITLNPGNPKQ